MRSVILVLTLVVIIVAMANAYPGNGKVFYDLTDAPILFEKFMKDYNRHYKNAEDKYAHYVAFVKNLDKINRMNVQSGDDPSSATFDINEFADYTPEEWDAMQGLRPLPSNPVY